MLGDLVVEPAARRAAVEGDELALSRKEFDLLVELARHAGTVVTREELMARVWDENWFGSTKTLDVHIGWLRRKLGDDAAMPRYRTRCAAWASGSSRPRTTRPRRRLVSLRVRLLLALAYVLLLAIVALEVPLALEHAPARRRRGALAGARPGRRAGGHRRRPAGARRAARELQALVTTSGATVRGRVIVVDGQGRLLADSAGTGLAGHVLRRRPEIAPRSAGTPTSARATAARWARISSPPRCRSAAPPGRRRWAPCGSPRASPRCTAPCGARSSAWCSSARSSSPSGSSPALVIARTIARPMRGLDRAARRVAAGDLEARAASRRQHRAARARADLQ